MNIFFLCNLTTKFLTNCFEPLYYVEIHNTQYTIFVFSIFFTFLKTTECIGRIILISYFIPYTFVSKITCTDTFGAKFNDLLNNDFYKLYTKMYFNKNEWLLLYFFLDFWYFIFFIIFYYFKVNYLIIYYKKLDCVDNIQKKYIIRFLGSILN